jgi:D-lactate dehydrogenase (cytochrome)
LRPSSATNTRSTDPAALEPFLVEGRGLYHGRSSMLLRPGSVDEVRAILKLA